MLKKSSKLAASLLLAAFSCSLLADDRLLYQLEDRVIQIEQKLRGSGMIAIAEDVSRLQAEMRALRGEIERLQHENNQAKIRQREMYLDLEKRIQKIEQQGVQPAPAAAAADNAPLSTDAQNADVMPAVPAAAVSNPQAEEKAYLAAFELLKQGRYPDAISGFNAFLGQYPQSEYADNARYWLGEAYYVSRAYPEALQSFTTLVETHPQSPKLPGALLKIGYINYERADYEAARAALSRITANYPQSSAAGLARQRLQRMDTEGR